MVAAHIVVATLCLLAALLGGCAPTMALMPDSATAEDRRRAAVCDQAARQAVPSAWTIVEEAAARSPFPTLAKVDAAAKLYSPAGLGLGWIGIHAEQQRRYTAAFDRCMIFGLAELAEGDTAAYWP